jgi:hypothetical protein
MTDNKTEFGWMVTFGTGGRIWIDDMPPEFGMVEVAKRTAKQVTLAKAVNASSYRTRVSADEVYSTREAAVEAVAARCIEQAKRLRERADKFEAAIKNGEKL